MATVAMGDTCVQSIMAICTNNGETCFTAVDSTFAGQVGPQGASNPSHNCGTEFHDKHKVSLSREVGGNWELGLCKMRNTTLLPFR